ncbi:MAG TPA: aminotransferase class I/II-fold pyridoxal phosphate-dependent enzyme [Longimicrobiales bacterium]
MQRRAFVRTGLAAALLNTGVPVSLHALTSRSTRLRSPADPVRLSSNENPLGIPDSARAAIVEALAQGHRYPQLNGELRGRIAARNGVEPANVVLGNGSAEILQMTVQAMSVGGRNVRVVLPDPTFEQVERYARAMGADVRKVPLLPDHTHDIQRMRDAAARADGPVLAFICNPNNPTGTITSCDTVAAWIAGAPPNVWFLIDEAYLEFVTAAGYRPMVREAMAREHVLVSRTFSKIYGLAGIRLGYGIAAQETARTINTFAAATNINHLAAAAALACIDDQPFIRKSLETNRRGLEVAYATFDELGIAYLPSHANFVLHGVRGDLDTYIARMREEGIRVGRPFPPMTAFNRVSIGLPEEMDAWAAALKRLHARGSA